MRTRIFLGLKNGKRTIFRSVAIPSESTHGHLYNAVVGPFRTMRAAILMHDCGNSPHIQTVRDAERISRIQANQSMLCKAYSANLMKELDNARKA